MISKKDLLKQMNISYGQLYRWKREGLIPDSWFEKQFVSTGQETYFKEELIIPRINKILELKDKYQLDQLKAFLEPDINTMKLTIRQLSLIEAFDIEILKKVFESRSEVSIFEAVIIYILSENKDVLNVEEHLKHDLSKATDLNSYLYILYMDKYYVIIASGEIILDRSIKVYKKIKLADVATKIASKL